MLVIHIGTHKTGTTSIQTALASNFENLLADGVHYLKAGRGKSAHERLPWSLRGRPGSDISVWADLRNELATSSSPIKIISSEAFWLADPAAVKAQLAGIDDEVRIVAYLRRQDQYLQSYYKQLVKTGRRESFDEWLEEK